MGAEVGELELDGLFRFFVRDEGDTRESVERDETVWRGWRAIANDFRRARCCCVGECLEGPGVGC